jgi:hypothetical protein
MRDQAGLSPRKTQPELPHSYQTAPPSYAGFDLHAWSLYLHVGDAPGSPPETNDRTLGADERVAAAEPEGTPL